MDKERHQYQMAFWIQQQLQIVNHHEPSRS